MATAFAFVWLLASAGGARGAESFSTGSMIGAVLGTFFSTLVAVTVVIVCLLLARKYRGKKGTLRSTVKTTGVESPLPPSDRHFPPEDIECRPVVRQDVMRVAPDNQDAAQNPRTSNKKRLKNVDDVQKLDVEDKTNLFTASVKQRLRQGEISCNRRQVKSPFSYDGQLPRVYTGLNDEETLVTLVSRDVIGLGFNIYGNMTEGIFVREVLGRGPAMESGLISQGDRILSISISTAHMVLEDALTILSYASSYPVTLRFSKTLGQETLFSSRSGPLSSHGEHITSTDVHSNDRVSRRPSIDPLYRSQSLDNLEDVKASADRSVSEFRSSTLQLKRTLSEFRSTPEYHRRNKKSSAFHRLNLQPNDKERLYRADAVELTLTSENLAPVITGLSVSKEPHDTTDRASRGDNSGENKVPGKISTVGLEQPIRCTATVANQDSSNQEVGGVVKNLSHDNMRIITKVAKQDSPTEEEYVFVKQLSNEDTKIDINDFDSQGTVRCRDTIKDIEVDDDDSHVVKTDFKASGVSNVSPYLGALDSKVSVGLNAERSDSEHFDHILTRNSSVDDRLRHSTEALSPKIEQAVTKKRTDSSEIEIVDGGESAEDHNKNNYESMYIMSEQIRNVAANSEQTEECKANSPGILGLEVSDSVECEEERCENNKIEWIHQKDVKFPVKRSSVIHTEDRPSLKQTTIEVTEVPQLQTNEANPATKGFLKTLKKLFSLGRNKQDDEETPSENEELDKRRAQIKRGNAESFFLSNEKTGSSKTDTQMTVVVQVEPVQKISFINAAVGKDVKSPEEDFDEAIAEFMGITSETGEDLEVCYPAEWNSATGDGIAKEPSKFSSAVDARRVDGDSHVMNNPLELKLDICQASSQKENEIEATDEVADSEVTVVSKNFEGGAGNYERKHLDQEIFMETPSDIKIQHSKIAYQSMDSSTHGDTAKALSIEPDTLAETSINAAESSLINRNQISARSMNDSSAETLKSEFTGTVASAGKDSHSKKQATELKKFQTDKRGTKMIKPILKKFPNVASSGNGSSQNTAVPKRMQSIPDDQVQLTETASTSRTNQTKEILSGYGNTYKPDDFRRSIGSVCIGVELEADTGVTYNERTRNVETDSQRLVENNKATAMTELQNHRPNNNAEAKETDTENDVSCAAISSSNYAGHPGKVNTGSCANESWCSLPEPNYANFPEKSDADSDTEESWSSIPVPKYANEEIKTKSDQDDFWTDTQLPSCANYPGMANTEFKTNNRLKCDIQSERQCGYDSFLLGTISDDFATLNQEIQDPTTSLVSDCKNQIKTPSQIVKSLLEKLQKFGKRDLEGRTNENDVSDRSRISNQMSETRDILIPLEKTRQGKNETDNDEIEEIGASEFFTDIDASKSRETWETSETNVKSCYIACENVVQLKKLPGRSKIVVMDDAEKKSRVVFFLGTVVACGRKELKPEPLSCIPKSFGDINNNSYLSG